MEFNKLRLLGFKSFVEPTEFIIEKGLTGVVVFHHFFGDAQRSEPGVKQVTDIIFFTVNEGAEFVGLADYVPAFDPSTTHCDRPGLRPMIPTDWALISTIIRTKS